MKKILVSLISEQTIPNILSIVHHKPDELWFISTSKMEDERKTECIENTLRLKGLRYTPVKEKVDQDSLADCINKMESLVAVVEGDVEYIVNMTGGTKVMALAAYEVFRGIGQKVVIEYMPLGKNELIQVYPRKKPLKSTVVSERLNLQEYLCSYGFNVQNISNFVDLKNEIMRRSALTRRILNNYEQLKGMLGFLYKYAGDKRGEKSYLFSNRFDRDLSKIEIDLLHEYGFTVENRLISKSMTKDDTIFLTGGWLEEYVFSEVEALVQEGIIDDAMTSMQIESLGGVRNELDIGFVKDNVFYHIECKTLGDAVEPSIVRDEIYKKGVISTLTGKGEKKAYICTTFNQNQITSALRKRAAEYGVEILSIDKVRVIKSLLKERFGRNK